ncbi:caspase family protein [Achromobacter xylosoxidans]|uniref:caspase family protein n=1 Tax=Alcaligenes xylosoxydans xylosoxydans TaxID=85698 RepID=UPI0008A52C0E|nr:caspase family protein [Achromobacter xylosoxidans]OFQ38195.1 peptidase C14 caspase catalytic subunit p20 [Achromobacter xylosoxidans]
MRDVRHLFRPRYTQSRALVIGIDKYAHASPLEYAVSDANGFRQTLIDSLGFEEDSIKYLTDKDATRQAILQAFCSYADERVDVDERLIVFYAGHGYTRSGIRGDIGFLVPHDGKVSDLSTLLRWDELTRTAEMVRSKHILFIMDACYGGLALTRHAPPGTTRFLMDMMRRPSRQVLTAGKANEVVADSGGPLPNHSVFTGHLLQGIQGKAATTEGVITGAGLMAYVYSQVANDKNSNQTPHFGYFDGDGDIILSAPKEFTDAESSELSDNDRLISVPFAAEDALTEDITEKVKVVKRLLASTTGTIELHDMLMHEVKRFLALTSEDSFSIPRFFSPEKLLEHTAQYEAANRDLSLLLACVAHWGQPAHAPLLRKCISRSSDRLRTTNPQSLWEELRWYPLILEMYSAGIAAVDSQNFDNLSIIFQTPVFGSSFTSGASSAFIEVAANKIVTLAGPNAFSKMPGYEEHHTPLSDYLFKSLQPGLDDALFFGKNYESSFDEFEVLFFLSNIDARIENKKGATGPYGRFAWKQNRMNTPPLDRIIQTAKKQGQSWTPLKAGLFGGRIERFERVALAYREWILKLNLD